MQLVASEPPRSRGWGFESLRLRLWSTDGFMLAISLPTCRVFSGDMAGLRSVMRFDVSEVAGSKSGVGFSLHLRMYGPCGFARTDYLIPKGGLDMARFRLDTDTRTFDAVSFDGAPTVTRSVLMDYIAYLDSTSDVNDWRLEFVHSGTAHIWRHVRDEDGRNLFGEEIINPDSFGNYRLDLAGLGLDLIEAR